MTIINSADKIKFGIRLKIFNMPTIDLTQKVKERLDKIKEKYGCKTYSEAVNLLLIFYEEKKKTNSKS